MNNIVNLLQAATFAVKKHSKQTRKGEEAEPYINHPLEVANLLAAVGQVTDHDLLIAAILHDTVEDTETTEEEIAGLFGKKVASIVMEVTDDKSLTKAERKQLQIEHAQHLSLGAKQLKIADKISNITDIIDNPPADWSIERRLEYIDWGEKVMEGLRGANADLENHFDELIKLSKSRLM